jgi:hypothetical protein
MRGFYSRSDRRINRRKTSHKICNFSKKRFIITGVTLASLATAAALSLSTVVVRADTEQSYVYESIKVMEEDSVWSIAKKYCPRDMEITKYIDEVEELNGISSDYIVAGKYILIPVYE